MMHVLWFLVLSATRYAVELLLVEGNHRTFYDPDRTWVIEEHVARPIAEHRCLPCVERTAPSRAWVAFRGSAWFVWAGR